MTEFQSDFKNESQESIGLSFVKVYNIWHRKIKEELKGLNLTHPQFVVLASLGYLSQNKEEVSQVEIAKQSDIDVMTISTIIRNLEKANLILRQNSQQDTRAKSVKLTSQGQDILNKALPIVESIDQHFFQSLNQDKKEFNALLHRLIAENT